MFLDSVSLNTRAARSGAPPAEFAAMMRTGREGHCWAIAGSVQTATASAAIHFAINESSVCRSYRMRIKMRPILQRGTMGYIVRILFTALMALSLPAQAQTNPVYVPLGPAKAVLYKPDNGPAPRVGIVVMHRVANYLSHVACTEFSRRGFMVLCMNSRFDNNEVRVVWETIALDVKAGVEYLKRQPGIAKIVLFGHSGGAPTMAFYQAVAENGVAFCQDPH